MKQNPTTPKIFILSTIFIITVSIINAQDEGENRMTPKFSIEVGGGYGFAFRDALIGINEDVNQIDDSTGTSITESGTGVYGSWGEGINLSTAIGVQWTSHFSSGINFNYIIGKNFSYTENFIFSGSDRGSTQFESYTKHFNSFSISPYSEFDGNACCRHWIPFIQMGLRVNISNVIKEKESIILTSQTGSSNSMTVIDRESMVKGTLTVGFDAAAGVKYKLNDHFGLTGKFFYNYSRFMPSKWTLTKYTYNGADSLSSQPVNEKEADLLTSFSVSITNTNPNSPSQGLARPEPAGSFGVLLLISYSFGSKQVLHDIGATGD